MQELEVNLMEIINNMIQLVVQNASLTHSNTKKKSIFLTRLSLAEVKRMEKRKETPRQLGTLLESKRFI